LPHTPTASTHDAAFFHAQYLERSARYAHAESFSISWLFLFGLLALGLGVAYWSLAAWETYFALDPYYAELRDITATVNALTAVVISLPALILVQLLFHSTTPWVQQRLGRYSGLWVAWWLTLWIGMGLPFGGSAGTLSVLSVAALLTVADQRRNLLLGKQAPIIGGIALLLGVLLSFQSLGALLWKASPWLALVLGFVAMRSFPFKDDPRGIFTISIFFVFSFGPWLTIHPRYTSFLSLARYNALHHEAGQYALQSLQKDHKYLPSQRFYTILYPLTKQPALRPQATRLLLAHWSQSSNPRSFPAPFLRQRCAPLDLPTLQKELKQPSLQKRLLSELFTFLHTNQTREDARWLLQTLEKSWPHHRDIIQKHLAPARSKPSPSLFPLTTTRQPHKPTTKPAHRPTIYPITTLQKPVHRPTTHPTTFQKPASRPTTHPTTKLQKPASRPTTQRKHP
jgi:hypothetical protein